MNVSLTPELEKFIHDTVATGRYNSASEVVRASLRRLEEEERWKDYAKAKIAKGLEDLAAGRVVDGETAMRRIRNAAKSRTQTKKAARRPANWHCPSISQRTPPPISKYLSPIWPSAAKRLP